jgi:hypothetical protein
MVCVNGSNSDQINWTVEDRSVQTSTQKVEVERRAVSGYSVFSTRHPECSIWNRWWRGALLRRREAVKFCRFSELRLFSDAMRGVSC